MSANTFKGEKKSLVNSSESRRAKKSFDATRKSSRQDPINGQKSAQNSSRGIKHPSASSQKPPVDRASAGSNRLGTKDQLNYESGINSEGIAKLSSDADKQNRTKSGFSGRQETRGKKKSLDQEIEGLGVKESITSSQFLMSKTSMSVRNADRVIES